jgi:regulatory protein
MHSAKPYTPEEARHKLERWCAESDHSIADAQEKMRGWGLIPALQEELLVGLISGGYLSDERFAHSYVRGKFRQSKWGRVKIAHGLRAKGIPHNLIQQALEDIDADAYLELLKELAQKKQREIKDTNRFTRMGKITRFLLSRGFESHLIQAVLGED